MDKKSRQEKFDVKKWYDSLLLGEDRCGTYDFCAKCDKDEQYPCACAMERFRKEFVRVGVVRRRNG